MRTSSYAEDGFGRFSETRRKPRSVRATGLRSVVPGSTFLANPPDARQRPTEPMHCCATPTPFGVTAIRRAACERMESLALGMAARARVQAEDAAPEGAEPPGDPRLAKPTWGVAWVRWGGISCPAVCESWLGLRPTVGWLRPSSGWRCRTWRSFGGRVRPKPRTTWTRKGWVRPHAGWT